MSCEVYFESMLLLEIVTSCFCNQGLWLTINSKKDCYIIVATIEEQKEKWIDILIFL